jgi:hypothetical protein
VLATVVEVIQPEPLPYGAENHRGVKRGSSDR